MTDICFYIFRRYRLLLSGYLPLFSGYLHLFSGYLHLFNGYLHLAHVTDDAENLATAATVMP